MEPADLIRELREARERTRRVVDDLAGERELGPQLSIVNPPRWEVGHVGWFQEFWCLRQGSEARPSILPNADALYNSATVPHDSRWSAAAAVVRARRWPTGMRSWKESSSSSKAAPPTRTSPSCAAP